MFDALLCWNWPFLPLNRLTVRITLGITFYKNYLFQRTHSFSQAYFEEPSGPLVVCIPILIWKAATSKAQVEFFQPISRGTLSSGICPPQVARHFEKNEVVDSNIYFWNISSLFFSLFSCDTRWVIAFNKNYSGALIIGTPKFEFFFSFFCDGHLWLAC
jgi:hypothetical protein